MQYATSYVRRHKITMLSKLIIYYFFFINYNVVKIKFSI